MRQTTGELLETDVAVEDSTVAVERGITGAAIEDPGDGVTFRFEEDGNGLVRATRIEMHDGQEVATGTQTLAITSAGDGRAAAPGTLDFDDIGLQLEIDADFTAGDLQFVEISSGASTEGSVAAGSLATPAAAEPAVQAPSRAAPSQATAGETALYEALQELDQREQQIDLALSEEEATLLGLVERLAGVEEGSTTRMIAMAEDDRDDQLRVLAESLLAQGSPPADRVMQLLA